MTAKDIGSCLPNLFIVGAPKCGTTAWVEYLRTHPNIFFPAIKDQCYFAFDLPNFRLTNNETDYAQLFAASGDAKVIGEASAMYLFSTAAAAAIGAYNPDAKILIFVRDQEEFLPSLHNQFLQEFAEEIEDFETAWRLSGKRPLESIPVGCLEPRTLDYAAMGRFSEQVERFLAAFPRERVRVIRFRDWVTNPRATYLQILAFLGLEDDGRRDFLPINEGATYRSRRLVRSILFPPDWARKFVRLVRRTTGVEGRGIYALIHRVVRALTARGYSKNIDPRLSNEIESYFTDDNRRLAQMLASVVSAEGAGPRSAGNSDRSEFRTAPNALK
jgi:hypothetical protein